MDRLTTLSILTARHGVSEATPEQYPASPWTTPDLPATTAPISYSQTGTKCNEEELRDTSERMQKMAQDERRARALFRYLQPENLEPPDLQERPSTPDVADHHRSPSLNGALAPFVQLAALRCNVQKAMLNFMDKDILYFLAEASRVQEDNEVVEDVIFLGCSGVPLSGRICEMTLDVEASPDEPQHPMFVVPDLSKDSRFSSLPFVSGAPFYRFYAGTPITTPDGINIGSLAIMDLEARTGLTPLESKTLSETADHVMSYLDVNRRAIEGRRARRMGQGFDCFVAGKRTLDENIASVTESTSKKRLRAAYGLSLPLDKGTMDPSGPKSRRQKLSPIHRSNHSRQSNGSRDSGSQGSEDDDSQDCSSRNSESTRDKSSDSRSHTTTFARAANLIRESFELGEDGGVQFFSVRSGPLTRTSLHDRRRQSSPHNLQFAQTNGLKPLPESFQRDGPAAPIVASSTRAVPLADETNVANSTSHVGEELLLRVLRRYPGGNLWSFDKNSKAASPGEDLPFARYPSSRPPLRRSKRSEQRRNLERDTISGAFPGAQQVLFTPMWDSSSSTFSHAVFVWTSDETRSLSSATDLTFLNSFCSTIMAECSRLSIVTADKQKSDFVGTISHEMRSPLHGLLASAEFLEDSDLNTFQRSLVDTIHSCGRTLLDTINHVLDYSKINSFMANNEVANRTRKRHHPNSPDTASRSLAGAPPLLQLSGATDISAVLEEVVDGITLGQTYASGLDITDLSREARGRGISGRESQSGETAKETVEVVVDIQKADWVFMTQPGAIRRIIMNIYGNSMKYTTSGTIYVKLQLNSLKDSDRELMTLTVSDTGKGISPEFLKSKVFVPFAQENALAPGTGLGLSIVRSILTMLGGEVNITSQVGEGTTVRVVIPLQRSLPGQRSAAHTPHAGGTAISSGSTVDNSADLVRTLGQPCRISLFGFSEQQERPGDDEALAQIVTRYIKDWYGLEVVDEQLAASATIIIVQEGKLEALIERGICTPGNRSAILVLCSVATRHSKGWIQHLESRINGTVEFISKPCGPYKLARSIRSILERENVEPQKPSSLGIIAEALTPRTPALHLAYTESRSNILQEMDLGRPGNTNPLAMIQGNETFSASQTSRNAQMAINATIPPDDRNKEDDTFPFPQQAVPTLVSQQSMFNTAGASKETNSLTNGARYTSSNLTNGFKSAPTITKAAAVKKVDPHILLVDDNQINLRLLQTYLKIKRKYSQIKMAEDGQQAVNAVTSAGHPFDVIFMDISMPVMNGFEATRMIREFEAQNNVKAGAMIIALTGLASGRDQTEGFDSGCDIYMTKPVSFKEVGKLLDNWEAHRMLSDGKNGDAGGMNGGLTETGFVHS